MKNKPKTNISFNKFRDNQNKLFSSKHNYIKTIIFCFILFNYASCNFKVNKSEMQQDPNKSQISKQANITEDKSDNLDFLLDLFQNQQQNKDFNNKNENNEDEKSINFKENNTLEPFEITLKKGKKFQASKPSYYFSLHGINNHYTRLHNGDKYITKSCPYLCSLELSPFRNGNLSIFSSLKNQNQCLYNSLSKHFNGNFKNKNFIVRCYSQGMFALSTLIDMAIEGANILVILQNCPLLGSELIDEKLITNLKQLLNEKKEPHGLKDIATGSKFINSLHEKLENISKIKIKGSLKIFNMCSYLPSENKKLLQNLLTNMQSPFFKIMLNSQSNNLDLNIDLLIKTLTESKYSELLKEENDSICTLKSQVAENFIPKNLKYGNTFIKQTCHEDPINLMIPKGFELFTDKIFNNLKPIVDDKKCHDEIIKVINKWKSENI